MPGFYTKTEAGHTVHINGDPNMSEETRAALCAMMEAAVQRHEAEHAEFLRIANLVPRDDDDNDFWWFRQGVDWQQKNSIKRIEELEKRLRDEIEAGKPPTMRD